MSQPPAHEQAGLTKSLGVERGKHGIMRAAYGGVTQERRNKQELDTHKAKTSNWIRYSNWKEKQGHRTARRSRGQP